MDDNRKILILNGPNLNRLGRRNTAVYGSASMEQLLTDVQRAHPELYLEYHQTNHEGELIDLIQAAIERKESLKGVVLNAGGLTHTSVCLRDAVEDAALEGLLFVEVHISDIYKREPFRQNSLLTDVCSHSIIGHGIKGYEEAIQWINEH